MMFAVLLFRFIPGDITIVSEAFPLIQQQKCKTMPITTPIYVGVTTGVIRGPFF